ncbi:MAG: hypothetical protein ABGZ17_31550 [Planctomycetaceae bacterium]
MYARVSVSSNQYTDLDFDRELPIIPEPHRKMASRFSDVLFDRGRLTRRGIMREFADAMWRRNRGQWSIEICNADQFMEFARSLLLVDGLNAIVSASRFTIRMDTGRCFDGREVATAVARIVHEHFFSAEELAVSTAPGRHRKVLVPADSTRQAPTISATEPEPVQQPGTQNVAVFRVMEPDDRDFGESLVPAIELLSIVEVETGDRYDPCGLCADAWIQAVGRARQKFLSEQLNAPESIIESQGNRQMIADELTGIPSGFGPINGYLYDNQCETWLIELDWDDMPGSDDMPDATTDSDQSSGSEPG